MENLRAYIDSLENGEQHTKREWYDIIDQDERFVCLSADELNYIMSELAKDGYITNIVVNEYGTEINNDAAVNLMDDDLREEIHFDLAPCTDQEFFDEYVKRHEEKFGETWELAKINPVY